MKIVPPNLRKVNNANDDKLPFEQPLKVTLRIYAMRWLVWLFVVFLCLIPLVVLWMVR